MSLNNKIVVVEPYFMLRHTPETYILCKKVQHILQIPIPILESPKNTRIQLKFLIVAPNLSTTDLYVMYKILRFNQSTKRARIVGITIRL